MKKGRDILSNQTVITVQDGGSVRADAHTVAEHSIGALPVLQREPLVGVFTERDVIGKGVAPGRDVASIPVCDVMRRTLVFAFADDTIDSITAKMNHADIRRLPVAEGDHLIGNPSIRELLAVGLSEEDETTQFLEQYIFTVPPGLEKTC